MVKRGWGNSGKNGVRVVSGCAGPCGLKDVQRWRFGVEFRGGLVLCVCVCGGGGVGGQPLRTSFTPFSNLKNSFC